MIARITENDSIEEIYSILLSAYGPQGWWPLLELHKKGGKNPTKAGSIKGYHPGDYSYPKNNMHRWEIISGALLTQNTSWPQVEKSLKNLKDIGCLSPESVLKADLDKIKEAIKPSGYFNQKSERLKELAVWFLSLGDRIPGRQELLSLKGIGPETADSILLYAFSMPEFVVDAYTRRIFSALGIFTKKEKYDTIKQIFESSLEKDFRIYQEYHALIVEHAKRSK